MIYFFYLFTHVMIYIYLHLHMLWYIYIYTYESIKTRVCMYMSVTNPFKYPPKVWLCSTKTVRPNSDVAPHLQSSSSSTHYRTMIIIALKFATHSEQYVDWGNNINYISMRDQNWPPPIFMRDQNSPPPIFMRDQNLPPPMNNMSDQICQPLWTICWLG